MSRLAAFLWPGLGHARRLSMASLGLIGLCLGCGREPVELRDPARRLGSGGSQGSAVTPSGTSPDAGSDRGLPPVDGMDDFEAGPAPAPPKGCQKVDFLFVVDNSISMFQEQSNLTSSFPGFMRVVEQTLSARDFHIMVVDTDGWDGAANALGAGDPCRDALGAGKRSGATGQDCGVDGQDRYLSAGQPDLEQTFACVAQVGTFGNIGEQPMDAMLQALGRAQNGPGGCNERFSREDAILVVTFITDEDDTRSSGSPAVWRQALLDAKAGNEAAVVVLGLVGDNNLDEPLAGGPCGFLNATGAPSLQSFVQGFEHGSLASVCASDYSPFFADAVRSIDTACDEFTPPVIQ